MAKLLAVTAPRTLPPPWRRSLAEPRFSHRLVGECADPGEALRRIRELEPDVVLLDARLPHGAAISACRALSLVPDRTGRPIPVVALSPELDDDERAALLRAGAAGYLLTTIDSDSLAIAVRGFADDEADAGAGTLPPEPGPDTDLLLASRRDVLGWLAAGAAVAAVPATQLVGAAVAVAAPEEAPPTALPPLPPPTEGESHVLRMQRELRRALAKPVSARRWVMVIDTRKCIGCHACTIACKAENRLPPGVVYRPVLEEEVGAYPNVSRRFLPRPCMQCEKPPCVRVCPVGATWKRSDGIVTIDYEKCIGCRYCIAACPYSARTFDFGEYYTDDTPARQPYEERPSPEYGRAWDRTRDGSPVGNARKCHFCLHRLNAGQLPACVTTCIGHATYFGDANDNDSLVSELIHANNAVRLKEELGTKPRVYYLV